MVLLVSQKGFSQTANTLVPLGNIGIGTLSPQNKLDVIGSTHMNGTVAIDSATVMKDSLRVQGKVVLKQKLVVEGKVTLKKDVNVKQNLQVDSNLSVAGNTSVLGNLILKSPNLNGYSGLLSISAGGSVGPPIFPACDVTTPFWMKVGNGGTNPGTSTNLGTDYLGTCDNQDLSIRTNAMERIRISAAGNVGVNGTANPNVMLNVLSFDKIGLCSYTNNTNPNNFNIKAIVDGAGADNTKAFAVLDNNQSTPQTFVVYGNGQTVIGNQFPKTNPNFTTFKLSVDGRIIAQEIVVENTDWADYVFKPNYPLMPLKQVADYIGLNQHLPDVPTEAEIKKDGNNLGDTQVLLLKKVEELTLYMIQQNKKIDDLQKQVAELKK
ncbi:MAG: hypothetical protein ABIZ51_09865 [Bacteroidia bacterium]